MSDREPNQRKAARRRTAFVVALVVVTTIAVVSAALAFTRPGTTERISRSFDGGAVDGSSRHPKLSADGRIVVFASDASNLVPGDTNNQEDVFVYDRATGETTFAAAAPDGTPPRFRTLEGTVSADGSVVAFYSLGRQRPEDPGTGLVYLKDLETGELELISIADDESPPDGPSFMSNTMNVISADNRYVVFMSRATNLVPGFTPTITGYHIYVRDRVAGRTELVSLDSEGQPSTDNNQTPAISADGQVVAWETRAQLTPQDNLGAMAVYARDLETETTELISVTYDGQSANDNTWRPRLSSDGRFVTFESTAWNLVPRDIVSCCHSDIFVRDRLAGRTEKLSVTSAGEIGNGSGNRASMTADGRYVAFWSDAPNMVPEGKPAIGDVYVHDLVTGRTELVSIAADGGFGDNTSQVPGISADGTTVAWFGWATNLTDDHDGTSFQHVHLRERGPALGSYDVDVDVADGAIGVSGAAGFAGDVVTEASDPAGDAGSLAHGLGADLTAASLAWRPEDRDLLARWVVTNIPFVADTPDLTYGMSFDAAGTRYEIRAQGREVPNTSINGIFGLYECEPVCVPVAELRGGYGTVGAEVQVAVPVELVGAPERIEGVAAYTASAQGNTAAVAPHDTVELPDAELPAPVVRIGIVAEGAEPHDSPVALTDGRFSTSIDTSDLPPGNYDIVISSCLSGCVTDRYPVTVGDLVEKVATALELAVEGHGDGMTLTARLTRVDTQTPISERTIHFYSDTQFIGSAQTDSDGVATVALAPGHRGASRTYEAIFAGDDVHGASSDTRPGRGPSDRKPV